MKRSAYQDRDYTFGQAMLMLRTTIGLTQKGLADFLGVSRRAVGDWEAGSSYPKVENLKQLITLAVRQQAFQSGQEANEIRALWESAHQKVLLNEAWLFALLGSPTDDLPDIPITSPVGVSESEYQTTGGSASVIGRPFQPTPFIGRETELRQLADILADPNCRLLTLMGPGGIGKTRLGVEAASGQTNRFMDGVVFVALASVNSASQIVSAIGDRLNLSFAGQTDPTASLITFLRKRHTLLVLDNFEHLLEGADLVYTLLQETPRLTILVTSRVRLNLQAEWLFDVTGLAYPALDTQGSFTAQNLTEINAYSAVQLFIQRAMQVQLGLSLTPSTLISIAHICQQLAGMPLAIELAAAAVRTHSIDMIEQQIRENLDVLSTTLRDMPARHRSMRAAFNHSWSLLDETERTLFSRLAVFHGSFTAEAAKQVAGAELFDLGKLIDKSLLRQSVEETYASVSRFMMLEPIREYALEQLATQGEIEALQRTHAQFYIELAEAAEAGWFTPKANEDIKRLSYELDNLRAALQWACDSGSSTLGLQLAGTLWHFWRVRGYIGEGRAWLAELLAHDESNPDPLAHTARLRALYGAALLASDQHDFVGAEQLIEQRMDLLRALGQSDDETSLRTNMALEARAAGEYQEAIRLLEETLVIHRAQKNRGSLATGGLGVSLYFLALVLREQGDFARAETLFKECVDFHSEIGERTGVAQGLLGLSDIARDQGDIVLTRSYCERSLAIFREFGTQWAIGFALNNLAQAAYMEGNLSQAFHLANEGISLFRSIKHDAGLAEALVTLGNILRAQGEIAAASEALEQALRLAWMHGPRLVLATALEALALVTTVRGHSYYAVQFLAGAAALRVQLSIPMRPIDQPHVEEALTSARLSLGSEIFNALWIASERLPLEQILGTILGGIPLNKETLLQVPSQTDNSRALADPVKATRVDWGDAFALQQFYGRDWELNLLMGWVAEERCRVVSVLGMGGIGKSALTITLMRRVAEHFDVVIWRSLRDIPTSTMLLDSILQALGSPVLGELVTNFERRLAALLEQMRTHRILLVIDNLESVLDEGEGAGILSPEYESFGRFLRRSAETEHQSCVLLTSREKPAVLISLEGSRSPVRAIRLAPLDADSCEQLLEERDVIGSELERTHLIDAYAGNPLALKIVSQTIVDLFDGEISPFLEQGEVIFGGIRELLAEQFARLSALEQSVLVWLAILREPSTLDEIVAVLTVPVSRARLLEVIEALHRRSLIERGQDKGSFTLQSVVLEYVTMRLIIEVSDEIQAGRLTHLTAYRLELAQAREYVRQAQQRLITAPILARLLSISSQKPVIEEQLTTLLAQLATQAADVQGYAPANLLSLLYLLRGELRGLDLSHLLLRSMYFQGVEMQDTSLSDAIVQDSVFTQTFDAITAVTISSSGAYWAAASRRGEVRVWVAGGQTLHRIWQAHTDAVYHLTFSPDGRMLASGGWDGEVKLWDVDKNTLVWSGRHSSHINNVAFSPDGKMLASSWEDASVRLWDTQRGTELQILPHPAPVSGAGVNWSPDGLLLATGDLEGTIRLWNVGGSEPATCVQAIAGHASWVDGLAFSPDGSMLASASFDNTVKLWDVSDYRLMQTLTGHTNRVLRVAWSPDGRTLASSSFDQTIWLWDVEQSSYRAVLREHTAGVTGIAFTPDGLSLLSGSEDGTLRVWDVTSGQCTRVIHGYAASLRDVDWSPDGTRLVSGGSDGLVTVWDVTGETPSRVLGAHNGVVIGVGWSPDGRWIASSEWDNAIRLWESTSGVLEILQYADDAGNFFDSLAWSPHGQRLASGTYRHGVQLFDLAARHQPVAVAMYELSTWIRHTAWSPNGAQLAGVGDDGTFYVWEANSGELLREMPGHQNFVLSLVWNTDNTQLASIEINNESGTLVVWDVILDQRLSPLITHPGTVVAVEWMANGQFLITGGNEGILRWWDIQRGICVREVKTSQGRINALKISLDGKMLASCGDDGSLMLWDIDSGDYVQTLRRDRPYERLNITGIKGLNDVQKAALHALGAIENN